MTEKYQAMITTMDKKESILSRIPAKTIPYAQTIFATSAFVLALIIGCYGHYYNIVRNSVASYPEEWFPSVSATIGDWYPEKSVCQILIALTAGPRLLLCYLWYLLILKNVPIDGSDSFAKLLFTNDIIRTISCGGWVFITSTDDLGTHCFSMLIYLFCTIPHIVGTMISAPQNVHTRKMRRRFAYIFFGALVPMVYYFIQHSIHHVPGAYSYYAIFEWSLIFSDLAFDAVSVFDFSALEIQVVDVGMKGDSSTNSKHTSFNYEKKNRSVAKLDWRDPISFAADVYLGFVFWSMLTSLPLMIWYFPLWNMGLSGYEAFLFCNVTVGLLGFTSLRHTIDVYKGWFHLASLIGIYSYRILDPAYRLMAVAAGVSLSLMTWGATFFGQRLQNGRAERGALTLGLGLILHNVVKQAWGANNPIWPIMDDKTGGMNLMGLILGIIACIQVIRRRETQEYETKSSDVLVGNASTTKNNESWVYSAISAGSYLFCLHSMFTEAATISRWSLSGYPNTGPGPIAGGLMVIMAMAAGLALSYMRQLVTSWIWFGMGSIGLLMLYRVEGDVGFFGGTMFTVFILSLFPIIFRSLGRQSPGRAFLVAMLVYNFLTLAHVWVVAYAFVPGGEIMRERTGLVITIMQFCLALGIHNIHSTNWNILAETRKRSALSTARFYSKISLVVLVLSSIFTSLHRIPRDNPQPYHPEHHLITAGIWTIHFALDDNMRNSELRMRDAIRDLELDVIGLLESDLQRMIMGNRDLTQFLAEDLNMYADYGPGPTKHTWGCTMLSKFPIKHSTHHLLPSPKGELACAIHATLDVYGKDVDVIVSHNGQEEDLRDRQLQTTELGRIMYESNNPFLFLGYVVTKPGKGEEIYELLMDGGRMHDVEPKDWDRWCEYLAFRGVKRTGYARISHGGITDTEIQVGKYVVPEDVRPSSEHRRIPLEEFKKQEAYVQIDEDQVPLGLRYPAMFYGDGIRGHRFHVFDRPYYYA